MLIFLNVSQICETLEFINQVLHQVCQRENLMGNSLDIRNPCEAFSSLVGNTCAERGINILHDIITKELQDNAEPSTSYARSSNLLHLGSHNGSITHPSEIPIISNPTGASVSVRNPFLRTTFTSDISSFQNTRQFLTSCAESQVLLLPSNNMKFSYSFPGNPSSTYLNANSWVKEIAIPPLLPGPATTSLSSSSRMNPFQYSCGNSISPHGTGGPQVMIQGPGKLVDSLSSSPAKSSSKSSSIASEPPDNSLSFPQDSTPQHSALFQFKDDQTSDQIDPCERSSVQITDSITPATKDNTTCVQSEAISCSQSTDPPHKPVEISVTNAMNSADTGCDRKGSTSKRQSQLLDNDLFEGMELDLSRGSLRQECWDDIIMPVNRSSCSNLSASVSDCISEMDMASLATADKGLFSGPSFEQLLEAVVGESVNLSTSHGSIPVNVNVSSVSGFDFNRQISTVRRVHCPQSNTKLAPPAELNLEKMIQESSKEALPKSYVSSWIDDSCTVNAESAVTNQAKKPEETPKVVRKRARPGESTRPRPKDRQQIQDRVKELREIVPNGAKVLSILIPYAIISHCFAVFVLLILDLMQQCSIDSLLDRTIKHMLFLQSVTKYADKLKQTDEPKVQWLMTTRLFVVSYEQHFPYECI